LIVIDLQRLTHGLSLRAVRRADDCGKKLLLPIAAEAGEAHLIGLLAGHRAGRLPPVRIRTGDGIEWVERNAIALAACPVIGSTANWCALDFDAAGHGHATAASPESAARAADVAADLLDEAGLDYVVAVSAGGAGRHVWIIECMPAAMAAWLAARVRKRVLIRVPNADIETRPGSDRAPGAPLTLPLAGAYAAHGGGRVLRIGSGRPGALAPLSSAWERVRADAEQLRARQNALRTSRRGEGDIRSADVPLDDVLERLTVITEMHRNGSFRARCPIHGGDHALTGNTSKRLWRCWVCGRAGAGDAASYTLTAFLLKDPPARDVFAALAGMRTIHV
jgi:hypothetical protein